MSPLLLLFVVWCLGVCSIWAFDRFEMEPDEDGIQGVLPEPEMAPPTPEQKNPDRPPSPQPTKVKGKPKGKAKSRGSPQQPGQKSPTASSPKSVKKKLKDSRKKEADKQRALQQQGKKGKKRCRGCHKQVAHSLYKFNSPFCIPCDASMASLYQVCRRQDSSEWYSEQRADEFKTKALIDNHRKHTKCGRR